MSDMRPIRFPDLPGWAFQLEEMSAGCYRADGLHDDGRSVSRMGTDEAQLLKDCADDARHLPPRRSAEKR
jgi:hypothetical protein